MDTGIPGPSTFRHASLPDSKACIRLLKIEQVEDNQPVQCSIGIWTLADAPQYFAISYTWGDPSPLVPVRINGQNLNVRENCDYVLRQAQSLGGSQYYWLDMVCIDQLDLEEKGDQVAMMGEIYKSAQHVLACVGRHANNSELITEAMADYRELFELARQSEWQPAAQSSDCQDRNVLQPAVRHAFVQWIRKVSPRRLEKLAYALERFLIRPYFGRVWVVQEQALARQLTFCLDRVSFGVHLLGGLLWVLEHEKAVNDSSTLLSSFGYSFLARMQLKWLRKARHVAAHGVTDGLTSSPATQIARKGRLQLSLPELLRVMSELACFDPRDKIYGALHLVTWNPPMQPDYTITNFDLALNVVHRLAMQKDDANLNYHNLARPLVSNFRLGSNDKCVADKMKNRRSGLENKDAIAGEIAGPACAFLFWGWQLSCNDVWPESGVDNTGIIRCRIINEDLNEDSTKLHVEVYPDSNREPESGPAYIYVPSMTKTGDWVLFCEMDSALIIRETLDRSFSIVGKAVVNYWRLNGLQKNPTNVRLPREDSFRVFFHAEDLILSAVLDSSQHINVESSVESIREKLSFPVCLYEGSSYAMREPNARQEKL